MVSSLWKDACANVIKVGPKIASMTASTTESKRAQKKRPLCLYSLPIRAAQAEQASWSDSSDQERIHRTAQMA